VAGLADVAQLLYRVLELLDEHLQRNVLETFIPWLVNSEFRTASFSKPEAGF